MKKDRVEEAVDQLLEQGGGYGEGYTGPEAAAVDSQEAAEFAEVYDYVGDRGGMWYYTRLVKAPIHKNLDLFPQEASPFSVWPEDKQLRFSKYVMNRRFDRYIDMRRRKGETVEVVRRPSIQSEWQRARIRAKGIGVPLYSRNGGTAWSRAN